MSVWMSVTLLAASVVYRVSDWCLSGCLCVVCLQPALFIASVTDVCLDVCVSSSNVFQIAIPTWGFSMAGLSHNTFSGQLQLGVPVT